jgi:Uma2 family endonuclease
MDVRAERRYTLADVYALPADKIRREVVDGVLFVSPSPRVRHQRAIRHLTVALSAWCEAQGGEVLPGGVNVDLADDTHLEPDLVVVGPGRGALAGEAVALLTPPDIVVEVSSPSTRAFDTGTKRARYARAGTPEFWFVDLDDGLVEVSVLKGERWYGTPQILRPGEQLTSPLLPDFALDVGQLLRVAS